MIKVWIFMAVFNLNQNAQVPMVVDNLATFEQCNAVYKQVARFSDRFVGTCMEVYKIKQ